MEKVWKSMENNNKQDYAAKILDIYEKMKHLPNWKHLADIHRKLEEEFKEKLDDFPVAYDTFYRQLKGKGTKKYMKIYFDYLYNLPEVQEELIKKPKNSYKTFLASLIIMIMLGFAAIYFTFIDDTVDKMKKMQTIEYKQCMKKCLPL